MRVDPFGRAAVRIAFPCGGLPALWTPLLFLVGLVVPPLLLLLVLVACLIPVALPARAAARLPIPAARRSLRLATAPRSPPL